MNGRKKNGENCLLYESILNCEGPPAEKVKRALQIISSVFSHAVEGIVVTDPEGTIKLVNPAFTVITGYEPEEAVGENPRILKSDRQPAEFYRKFWESLKTEGKWEGEIWNRRKNGEVYPEWLSCTAVYDENGNVTDYISVFNDLSEVRFKDAQIEMQSNYDQLTGLSSRSVFYGRVRDELSRLKQTGGRLAILVLDINRFKIINDSLGHPAGDAVLQEVGKRLAGHLGSREKISRIGGDDFHILLSDVKTVEEVASRAEKLIHILDEPVNAGGNRLFLSASLGAAIFPEDGNKAETLLKKADLAMHKAKEYGISSLRFYTEELSDMVSSRLTLENSLRRGLENKEFSLVYQPKFSLAKRRVEGFEALLRWKTPERLVSPWEFIPVAEEIGLILPLGEWVFLEVCRQIAAWRDEGFLPGEVAVNLSAKQLHHSDLLPMIRKALDEYSVDASLVGVEITESGLMENIAGSVEILSGLKELGMKVYVDDFGTGYSSLNYLKRLPIDVLKIDKSFIDGVYVDRSDAAITRAIIGLGKALGMEIIAEGVESAEQLDFLLINGCDGVQGYLLSPPVSPTETLPFRKNEISPFFLNLLQRRGYAAERGAASE